MNCASIRNCSPKTASSILMSAVTAFESQPRRRPPLARNQRSPKVPLVKSTYLVVALPTCVGDMNSVRLSKAETRILEQYWKLGTCSVREILDSLPEDERVAYTTVQTLVYRLEQKGALRKVKKIGNAQLFEPAIDQNQYRTGLVRDLLDLFGGSPRLLVSNLLETGDHHAAGFEGVAKRGAKQEQPQTLRKSACLSTSRAAMYYFGVHLLYASLVCVAAWVLTSIPRGSATTKYWIWVATALNFIFPLGAIVDRFWTSHLSWATPLSIIGDVAGRITRSPTAGVLCGVWLLGATAMLTRLCLRIRAERGDAQAMAGQNPGDPRRSFDSHGVAVRFVASRQAPAVDGVLHPYISLPHGIDRVLSEPELSAVLIHELTHARRRDNLIRLIHELGLCGLWFHPLVWITGSQLALYRELSCDELVIQRGHGGDLVSALAKLANPEEAFLLQATASSFISRRLARLTATEPHRTCLASNMLLAAVFGSALLAGVLGTVAHTACCFIAKK